MNESIYMYTEYHSKQALLYTQFSLISFRVILIFKIFSCVLFEIHYRPEAVVCQNILKATVQCTAAKRMPCNIS
jgi:hypothetical protein